MQDEIHRLYVQKMAKEPSEDLAEFIKQLTVREVARIWSLMGDGGDFIAAMERVVTMKITKLTDEKDHGSTLDDMVKKLKEKKKDQEQERIDTDRKAIEAESQRKEAEKRLEGEKKAAEQAEKEKTLADARAEAEKKTAAEAAQKKIDADKAAAAAAEKERQAAERAAQAASNERAATEEAVIKAQEELERLKKEAAEAEQQKLEAEKKAAAEKKEAERKEVLRLAAKEREEETKRVAAKAEAEKKHAERKAKVMEEQKRKEEEEEAEEELKEETVKITLEAVDEALGLDCLAGAGRVRIIEVSGACQRAGVKSASLLLRVDGHVVDSQETLIESVRSLREQKKMTFDITVLPPLMMSDEDKEILKQYNDQKEEIEQWLKLVDDSKMMQIEMRVVQALGLSDKGSTKPFCEVKLREVKGDKVGSDHANPQKVTTKVVTCEKKSGTLGPAVWQQDLKFDVPKGDCIRVSIFGNKRLSKEHLGKVDLIMPELLEELCVGPIIARWPLQNKEGKAQPGELELALNLATCDGKVPPE